LNRDSAIIKQMWFHQYDAIPKNHASKRIRVVIDLYTSVDYFFFDLSGIKFTDLSIKARNLNKELGFISFNGLLKISLGELLNWPKVSDVPVECENCSNCNDCSEEHLILSKDKEYYHVKLDVGYTLYHPDFYKYGWGSGYESYTIMQGIFEDEFHLNIPNGLEIDANSVVIRLHGKKNETDKLYDTISFKVSEKQIDCNKDALNNRYTLMVDDKRYSNFIKTRKYENIISLVYKTKNSRFYYLINLFAFVVFFLNFINFIFGTRSDTSLIALISFSVLYLALIREGYVFALNKLILGLILLSGGIFTLMCFGISWVDIAGFLSNSIANIFSRLLLFINF
jgi:hypothetical protein